MVVNSKKRSVTKAKHVRFSRANRNESQTLLNQISGYEVENKKETFEMMRFAESSFSEWLDPEENIYDEKS
jgi:hypothetical protein